MTKLVPIFVHEATKNGFRDKMEEVFETIPNSQSIHSTQFQNFCYNDVDGETHCKFMCLIILRQEEGD